MCSLREIKDQRVMLGLRQPAGHGNRRTTSPLTLAASAN